MANGIDKHLLGQHIGGFELAAIYLDWHADRDRFESQLGVALRVEAGSRATLHECGGSLPAAFRD